nr:sulfurtransferase [Acidothermus cellulolyticus]
MSQVPDLLVDVAELAEWLDGPRPPVLIDVRWNIAGPPGVLAYRAGHLPGAVFLDIDGDVCGRPGTGGRHPLPHPDDFQECARRAGISENSDVVVYDAADSTAAARMWWTLRYFGHERVRVLNGGYAAWVAAGYPVTTDVPQPPPGNFVARPGNMPVLDADGAAEIAASGVLADVRVPERFRGEVEPYDPVGGHIPGARNVPSGGNIRPDGRFRDPVELRDRFTAAGMADAAPVGVYCGSGIHAAHTAFAMTLAGLPTPPVYIGSWSNWVADRRRSVAVGDAESQRLVESCGN